MQNSLALSFSCAGYANVLITAIFIDKYQDSGHLTKIELFVEGIRR